MVQISTKEEEDRIVKEIRKRGGVKNGRDHPGEGKEEDGEGGEGGGKVRERTGESQ